MYDAVLFVVMVSLSGVVLIPALQNDIAIESSLKKHQEHTADEALNALLVSRADEFEYLFAGDVLDVIDGLFEGNDIYNSLSDWLLSHEQLHKTYANLIADDLGCQFTIKLLSVSTTRSNILTGEFDEKLKDSIKDFLASYLSDKYGFRFTAAWYPIKHKITGALLGGEIVVGSEIPLEDCFVSQSFIAMPYNSTESFINAISEIPFISALYSPSDFEEVSINRAKVRLVIWKIRG